MGAALGLMLGLGLLSVASTVIVPRRGTADRRPRIRADLLLGTLVGGVGVGVPIGWLTSDRTAALVVGLVAGGCVLLAGEEAERRRRRTLSHAWPAVVEALLDALRAGFDLRESWTAVVRHAPVPLRPEVATLARDLEVTSDPARPLRSLRQRLADPTTDRVVEALLLASDSGQPGLLLRLLAADLRPDAAAASRRSTTRVSTRAVLAVAAAVPWVCCEFFGEAGVPWPDSGTVMGLALTLFGLALADRTIEGGLSARMWR